MLVWNFHFNGFWSRYYNIAKLQNLKKLLFQRLFLNALYNNDLYF